jgi:hypothetical protein
VRLNRLTRSADNGAVGEGTLVVDCRACARTFVSVLGVGRVTFDFMNVEQMVEMCPSCCTTLLYDKADYRFEELPDDDTS